MDNQSYLPRRILVVTAHPRPGSLSDALAQAYGQGAREAGAEVRTLVLRDLSFERDVLTKTLHEQATEPDLAAAREAVTWAQHLVFVYPTWWGTMPALMKAFLDRLLLPGFAFREIDRPPGFEGLLKGRSAHLITTMDTPPMVYRLLYRAPGHNAMARATLGFAGVGPTRVSAFGPVKSSTATQREQWIASVRADGLTLAGCDPRGERPAARLGAWLRALRLQFYPMTWAAYTVGALLAADADVFGSWRYWLGYLLLFLLEAATVFVNERFDLESDRNNDQHGPFTGGSRVLVEGIIGIRTLEGAAWLAGFLAILLGALLVVTAGQALALFIALATLLVLALGYTSPPLRLSYRTLGELDVAWTHSIGVMLVGWLLMEGAAHSATPWLVALPLGLSVLPAIILSGLPDHDADRMAGKRTIAVALGDRTAVWIALGAVVLSATAAIIMEVADVAGGVFDGLGAFAAAHGIFVVALLGQRLARRVKPGRMDGLMVATLSYIVWFAVIPLVNLL